MFCTLLYVGVLSREIREHGICFKTCSDQIRRIIYFVTRCVFSLYFLKLAKMLFWFVIPFRVNFIFCKSFVLIDPDSQEENIRRNGMPYLYYLLHVDPCWLVLDEGMKLRPCIYIFCWERNQRSRRLKNRAKTWVWWIPCCKFFYAFLFFLLARWWE